MEKEILKKSLMEEILNGKLQFFCSVSIEMYRRFQWFLLQYLKFQSQQEFLKDYITLKLFRKYGR